MSRVKSAALRAPKTTEEATELLAQLAAVCRTIAAHDAQRDEAKQQIDAAADACIVPLAAERDDLFKRLQPWYEGNVADLTGGKRKSIELGGCTIGHRTTPPKLVFEHGKDADGVAALQHFGRTDGLLKIPAPSLVKAAILAELANGPANDDAIPLELLGFAPKQSEEFFIEPIAAGVGPATIA
ncbi:host-nuclease inhibitor Gam family protein [uncultured Sphingomonas sp.]|uniref:host-nuclease inhibitor Gam family protein n=1 Tax=uncultured Sphingomonas sp. TaxID=158754 RepID=UPI0025F963A6|nr:host-nuclease inhibitor Gam family protein [uncultured Sphingomonas sp.]